MRTVGWIHGREVCVKGLGWPHEQVPGGIGGLGWPAAEPIRPRLEDEPAPSESALTTSTRNLVRNDSRHVRQVPVQASAWTCLRALDGYLSVVAEDGRSLSSSGCAPEAVPQVISTAATSSERADTRGPGRAP